LAGPGRPPDDLWVALADGLAEDGVALGDDEADGAALIPGVDDGTTLLPAAPGGPESAACGESPRVAYA
jgi:hypothetical protein